MRFTACRACFFALQGNQAELNVNRDKRGIIMKKIIKPILALSALILILFGAHIAGLCFSGAYGNEWDALFNAPPFYEVAYNDEAGGATLSAPVSNESGSRDNDGYAGAQNHAAPPGIKDCASGDALALFSALLALLCVYAVLRVARRRGRPVFKHKA